MKRILPLILFVSLLGGGRMFAALGNTELEVEALFGAPVHPGFPDKKGVTTNVYQKGDYIILVQFLKHLSLAESYTRSDQHEFSQREIDAFLEGSSNGMVWIKDSKDPNKQAWGRSDQKAIAWYQTLHGRPTLLIEAQ